MSCCSIYGARAGKVAQEGCWILSLLAYSLLRSLGEQHKDWGHKKLYPDAKNLILRHLWRGNVRELQSTLLRVALWCQGEIISDEDVRLALFQMPEKETGIAEKDVSQGVDIQ